MQTFKGSISLDFKIVVPEAFLAKMRAGAADPEKCSPFLRQLQVQHPDNDDAFIAALLKNGIRKNMRDHLIDLLEESGLGGSASPAKIDMTEVPHGFDAPAAQPQLVLVGSTKHEPKFMDKAPAVFEEVGVATAAQLGVTPPPGMGGYGVTSGRNEVAA